MTGNRVSNKFSWERAVAESDLPATSKLVAFTLGLFFSKAGDSCWPSMDTLADRSGLSRSTVIAHLGELRRAGWIALEHQGGSPTGGKRTSNRYEATIPHECLPFDATGPAARPVQDDDRSGSNGRPVVLTPTTGPGAGPYQSVPTSEQSCEPDFEANRRQVRQIRETHAT